MLTNIGAGGGGAPAAAATGGAAASGGDAAAAPAEEEKKEEEKEESDDDMGMYRPLLVQHFNAYCCFIDRFRSLRLDDQSYALHLCIRDFFLDPSIYPDLLGHLLATPTRFVKFLFLADNLEKILASYCRWSTFN